MKNEVSTQILWQTGIMTDLFLLVLRLGGGHRVSGAVGEREAKAVQGAKIKSGLNNKGRRSWKDPKEDVVQVVRNDAPAHRRSDEL